MDLSVFFVLLSALGLTSFIMGRKAQENTKSSEDYFLMKRSLPFFGLTMTLFATQLGGGTLLGAAQEAYERGWSVLLYPLGTALGLMILGIGFGNKIRNSGISTLAEIFEKKFHSISLRRCASILSITALFFILVGQAIATKKFFVSLGGESLLLFGFSWMVVVFYTAMGGFKGVVRTDALQGGFIMISLLLAFLFSLVFKESAPLAVQAVSSKNATLPLIGWLITPFLFTLMGQDMGQRCSAAKSSRTIAWAASVASLAFMLSALVPIYFGIKAAKYGVSLPEGGSVLMAAATAFTPSYIASFVGVAILMAIVSTADSLLCAISMNLSCDFSFLIKGSEENKLKSAKLITLFVGLASLLLSFLFENVIQMLLFSYELSMSVLCVPMIFGLLSKRANKRSAAIAMFLGAGSFLYFHVVPSSLIPKEIMTLGLSAMGFFASEWLSRREPQKELS